MMNLSKGNYAATSTPGRLWGYVDRQGTIFEERCCSGKGAIVVTLVPMTEEDFEAYLQEAVADYAQEHVRSGHWSEAEALEQSSREFDQLLPDGVATPNHYLYIAEDAETHDQVGMLWFAVRENAGEASAFIYAISIDPKFRRRGYATQVIQELDNKARELGLKTIRLHVFGHNLGARALYEKLGFETTNVMMAKTVEP